MTGTIPNIQSADNRGDAPGLLVGQSMMSYLHLPDWSEGPDGTADEVLAGCAQAGFAAVQSFDAITPPKHGLVALGMGRIDQPNAAREAIKVSRDQGFAALTVHVGSGFESDAEIIALGNAIVEAAAAEALPVYIETHRATITQDPARTLKLVHEVPDIRFNGDFSHWYTGVEMPYGDLQDKLARLAPVFARTRFLHGRVSAPGAIQVPVTGGKNADHLAVFEQMWEQSFLGFLNEAAAGEMMAFVPELLPSDFGYARLIPDGDEAEREESDRWAESLFLMSVAKNCWQHAFAQSKWAANFSENIADAS